MSKQILLVGLGTIGTSLASFLLAKEHPLTMWDSDSTRVRPIPARRITCVNACDVVLWPPETPIPDVVVHCYSLSDLLNPEQVAKTYLGAPYALVTRFPKARHVYVTSFSGPGVRSFVENSVVQMVRCAKEHCIVRVPQVHGLFERTNGQVDSLNKSGCEVSSRPLRSVDGNELLPFLEDAILGKFSYSTAHVVGSLIDPVKLATAAKATFNVADVSTPWYGADYATAEPSSKTKYFIGKQPYDELLALARGRVSE